MCVSVFFFILFCDIILGVLPNFANYLAEEEGWTGCKVTDNNTVEKHGTKITMHALSYKYVVLPGCLHRSVDYTFMHIPSNVLNYFTLICLKFYIGI